MSFTLQEGGFKTEDYVVFFVLCISSCVGGFWYSAKASTAKKVVDVKDYLLGGKTMSTVPVSLSLIASYVSGVTILGTPAEIYNYGLQYLLIIVAVVLCITIVIRVYMPVFATLQLSSSYEYLELRFNRRIRAVASILFLLDEVFFLPMVVYVPALACNQLTGLNEYVVGCIMVIICGFYTVFGGLRAVVWTDSVQTTIMFLGVIVVAVAGTVSAGGVVTVIDNSYYNNRLHLDNWNFSPYERQTGWGAIIGGTVYWTCFNSVNQTMVQRYISLPTERKTKHAIILFACGCIFAIMLCVWNGLIAFTAWSMTGCVPSGVPPVNDRLLPAFVTYVSHQRHLYGLPGVFLAGVFGAGLSSLSAVLNACALVAVEDLLHGWLRIHLKPLYEGIIARSITALLAITSVIMLVVVSKLGGVLGVATSLSAIAASTTCGVFTLGMVCWWVGPRGAMAGAIAGALVAGTICLGSQAAAAAGLRAPPMPFNDACAKNATFKPGDYRFDDSSVFPLFRLSYHWIAPMGFGTTLLVGAVVGWLCDVRVRLDSELFTPCVWRLLPKEAHDNAGFFRRRFQRLHTRHDTPDAPLILGSVSATNNNDAKVKNNTTNATSSGEHTKSTKT